MIDESAVGVLLQLGVAGVGLYLFATGKLLTKAQSDERVAEVARLYEARISEGDERYDEMRVDRNEWKALALGTERRLDAALPTVAAAVGAAVPSTEPAPPEAR